MESVIQQAAKGNRGVMTLLYEATASAVYCLSKALLRGSQQAIPATNWAIKSTFQATEKGLIQTEEDFCAFAVKQAAGYCKKEVVKKDPSAFKLPPKKEFRVNHINEQAITADTSDMDNYIQCLPAIQRFAFVLRHLGNMDNLQIGKILGMDTRAVELIFEAEDDNLAKIYRAVKAVVGHCKMPAKELIANGFADMQTKTILPDESKTYIENYIDSVAAPIEAAAKNKGKKLGIIAGVALACIAILIAIIAGAGNFNDITVSDGDYIEDSVTDATNSSDTTDATDGSTAAGKLDADTVYYADIAVENYGTITVQLDQSVAPITVANFVELAESGFYDGLTFHRIYSGFMIQGGDPEGDGTGGSDEEIVGEFASNGYENTLSHTRGIISMARSDDYDSASSQFFIVHEDSDFLDGEYAAFGWVTEGMDIVDAICEDAKPYDDNGMIYAEDQPVISSITIRTETADTLETTDANESADTATE